MPSDFIALAPVRWCPERPHQRQLLVFPYREDRLATAGELPAQRVERLMKEGMVGSSLKFIGGMVEREKDGYNLFAAGAREFFQESYIFIPPLLLRALVLEGCVERSVQGSHTKHFMFFNANLIWRQWQKDIRKEVVVDEPDQRTGASRKPEVLGIPQWVDMDYLLESGEMNSTHLEMLQGFAAWIKAREGKHDSK